MRKTTYKCIILAVLLFLTGGLRAQTSWYVDNTNTDPSPDGSITNPWTTLAQVNAGAGGGDIVYFKRGQVYYGTLIPQDDHMQYDAWGTGDNPKISGFTEIDLSAYSSVNGAVYRYPLALSSKVRVVKMNDALLEIGRQPNSDAPNGGYYTYPGVGTDGTGKYITAGNVNELVDNAGEVVIRTENYSIETKSVLALNFTNKRIYYGSPTGFNGSNYSFAPQADYGYYFQDGLKTLDKNGEWFYDKTNHEFCFYSTTPPSGSLYIPTIDVLCNLHKLNNISISNIDFEGAGRMAIDMGDNSDIGENNNIEVTYCNFAYIGVRAIHARHTKGLYVYGCNFSHCTSGAIQFFTHYFAAWQPINKLGFSTFTDIAPYPGMAYNADIGDNNAITMFTSAVSDISGNTFDGVGKSAICWQGSDIVIGENKIAHAMKNFADYGAVYTYDDGIHGTFGNRIIRNNLVHDCPGNISGTRLTAPIANGIYLDGQTADVNVAGNTIFNMGSSGIMSNCPRKITLQNNTLYNNVNGIRYSHLMMYLPNNDIDITIINNKIYSERGQANTSLLTSGNRLCAAISFTGDYAAWTDDLQGTHCEKNAYSFTNPLPFNLDVPNTGTPPSRWVGIDTWSALADEQVAKNFPARANFMPNGQAYVINNTPIPYYTPTTTYTGWNPIAASTATTTVTGGELKVEFTSAPNTWAAVTRIFNGVAQSLQPSKSYIFSYRVRADAGTKGICRSYVRTTGTGVSTYPTADNYRTYTDAGTTVHYLINVPASMANPVFCIEIDRRSGTSYISNISIDEYNAADIQVDNASDFNFFSYNPNWYQPSAYTQLLPPANGQLFLDGFGFVADAQFDFDDDFQSIVLFREKMINARPYRVEPPLASAGETKIKVYPNPASDVLIISQLKPDTWERLDIINSEGKILLSKKINPAAANMTANIAVLQKGLYIAVVTNKSGGQGLARFIKN